MESQNGTPLRTRIGAIAAAAMIGLAGVGAAGCGDDDNEGPVEEAGKAIDEGAEDVGNAAEDAANSDAAKDAGQELEEAGNDVKDAAEEGVNEATTDDDK
jgi:hypothetical protein